MLYKLIRAETKVLNASEGRIQAVVSTESTDREGDIIRQGAWDLGAFQRHPVLVASHNYRDLRSQIGEWTAMGVKGKRLVGEAQYYIGQGNDQADWAWNLATRGKAAYSVGFIPDLDKAKPIGEGDGWSQPMEFNGQELLEVSQVVVPANADALQLMAKMQLSPVLAELVAEEMAGAGTTDTPKPLPDALIDLNTLAASVLERLLPDMDTHMAGILERLFEDVGPAEFAEGVVGLPIGITERQIRAMVSRAFAEVIHGN